VWGNDGSWVGSDAQTIARAVTNREVSASQVLDDHLAHIKARNPELNAVITVAEDQAIRAADDLDIRIGRGEDVGPLAGVPFTVKDLIATAGVRTTAGSRALEHNVPSVDAPAVAAMRAAGAILVGKTNTPEFGASGLTHNDLFGYTVNPLRPGGVSRSPGGSSGGEAAAISSPTGTVPSPGAHVMSRRGRSTEAGSVQRYCRDESTRSTSAASSSVRAIGPIVCSVPCMVAGLVSR